MKKCEITGKLQEIYGENDLVYIKIKSDGSQHTLYGAIHFENVKLIIKEENDNV